LWRCIWGSFYLSRSSKPQFGYNRKKITGTSHKDLRLFIYGTTLVKDWELLWLPWLLFFKTRLPLGLVSVIRERTKSRSLCGYLLSCCALTDEDDAFAWMHYCWRYFRKFSIKAQKLPPSQRISVCPQVTTRESLNVFCLLNLILRSFTIICWYIPFFLEIGKQ